MEMEKDLSKTESVKCFLREIKETITSTHTAYQTWTLVPRTKNTECLAKLGYTLLDVRDQILDLSIENYVRGPYTDNHDLGSFWEFGTIVNESEIYIKLKLATFNILRTVRIVSFHFAEKPMAYPLRL
jgi:hypothetical protein